MADLRFSEECIDTLADTMINSPLWCELDMGVRPQEDVVADMKTAAPRFAGEIDRFFENSMDVISVRPQSESWFGTLRDRGLGVYLLSNYPRHFFEQHLQKFDFMHYVDGYVVSSYVHLMKPDAAIYRTLMNKYGLKAEECAFVDDRPENTAAAELLGIRSVTYVDAVQAKEELERLLNQE